MKYLCHIYPSKLHVKKKLLNYVLHLISKNCNQLVTKLMLRML